MVRSIPQKVLVFCELIVTLPFFFIGKTITMLSLDSKPALSSNSKPALSSISQRETANAVSQLARGAAEGVLIPEGNQESGLQGFAQSPSWQSYSQLSQESRYLIAARYFYKEFGWSISSKEALLQKFEDKYRLAPQVDWLHTDIRVAATEAKANEEKIELLESWRNNISAEDKIAWIGRLDQVTKNQILRSLANKSRFKFEEAENILMNDPTNASITTAIDFVLSSVKGGYPSNYFS